MEASMKRVLCLSPVLIFLCAMLYAQNAKPFVNQPLIPASAAPGASGFTLTVNGTGFATGAVVRWNGSDRTTTLLSSSSVQATINATDVAHAGTASVTVTNPTGGTSNAAYFPVRTSAASVFLAPNPGVTPLAGPVATGDFTGDGKLDLVVGQTSSDGSTGSILFYKGMGNGTFAAPITTTSSLPVMGLLAADINGDGKLDVMIGTINGSFGPVTGIAFLGDGTGHFTEKTGFGSGDFGPGPIAFADLNGDGVLDVVFGSEVEGGGTIYFFLGNGNGNFTLKSKQDINGSPGFAAIGDFNGDGKLDVAVPDSGGVDIFIGNGDGTFQPFVATTGCTIPGGIAAADFNGDGKLDLAVGQLCILLGNGDGTFTAGANYGAGSAGVLVGDFNGDGKLDVVTAGVWVYLGNGDGTFQPALPSPGFASNLSSALPFGDFNHDGELDIASWTGGGVQVGLQTNLSVSVGSLSFGAHKVGTTSALQGFGVANIGSRGIPISSIALTGADPGDFVEHNTCGTGLQVGKNCIVQVAFKPTAKGARSATLSITYSGVDSPQSVALSGTGS